MSISSKELEDIIFDRDGEFLSEHAAHMQSWYDGFNNGYRRADSFDWDARRAAAVDAGLRGLERTGCFPCLEVQARHFNRTYEPIPTDET
ncbi:hypothetical protein [Nocardia sp. alder85J]|uniref:hypothetical protein n=1 Tax=Nocardia sp. alder85J TaxID=2862949 RepID=UPI001CD5D72A|nr:hypothetical protein [Nocardia sp. alder85J]MCX4099118.1 hypothetical protein [Nocardia sp. alder85J]